MKIHRSPVIVSGQPRAYAKGCAVTGASGFVFLSGAVGRDCDSGNIPERLADQVTIALDSIKSRLEEYGSSLSKIVFIRKYFKGGFPNGMGDDAEILAGNAAMEKFWQENCPEFMKENNPPATTILGVTALGWPELLVEIEVIAAIS